MADTIHHPISLSLSLLLHFKTPFFVPISYIPRSLLCPMSSIADVDGLRLSIHTTVSHSIPSLIPSQILLHFNTLFLLQYSISSLTIYKTLYLHFLIFYQDVNNLIIIFSSKYLHILKKINVFINQLII